MFAAHPDVFAKPRNASRTSHASEVCPRGSVSIWKPRERERGGPGLARKITRAKPERSARNSPRSRVWRRALSCRFATRERELDLLRTPPRHAIEFERVRRTPAGPSVMSVRVVLLV